MKELNLFPDKNFWDGKTVFISGHSGFKGGWLSLWLKELGANVSGYSLEPNTKPSFYNACDIGSVTNSIFGNILDYKKLESSINKFKPEIIIHMAAQALVLESYKNPLNTYETNIIGTLNILEIIRNKSYVKVFINVTSDKCYENIEKKYSYKESDRMGGHDPYSSSKGCSELVTSAYRLSFFNKKNNSSSCTSIASARSGNVVGGGDWSADRLIPDFFRAVSQNKDMHIRHPNATRPWQHVLEPIRGYLILAELMFKNEGYDEPWNFGPNNKDTSTVKNVLEELASQWNENVNISYSKDKSEQHEANLLNLDITKTTSMLNWHPLLSIKNTIALTCEWYRNFYSKKSEMQLYTLEQIKKYESLLK